MHRALAVALTFVLPAFVFAQDDEALLRKLANGDRRAMEAVIKKGNAIFPDLTKVLMTHPRDDNQCLIIFAVAEIARDMGPKAKAAIPVLCTLLKSQDKAVASDAGRALGYIGAEATPQVLKTLKAVDQDAQQLSAVRALKQIGPGAKAAAPALTELLGSSTNPHLRLACLDAFAAIGPSGKQSVNAMLALTKDDKKVPYTDQLIIALGSQGADAKEAVPFLVKALREAPEPHFKMHALEALAKIGPGSKEVENAVAVMLDTPNMPKVMVLESLNKGGPLSKPLVKAVEELMRDKDANVRLQAALMIGKTNANHPAVVSILIESLKDKEPRTRRIAAEAIGTIRPSDEAVIEALQNRAKDGDPGVRKAVEEALRKFKK